MEARHPALARIGAVFAVCVLLAHVATGTSMVHALGLHGGSWSGAQTHLSESMPAQPVAIVCPDGGSCSLADRVTFPVGLDLLPVLVMLGFALGAVLVRSKARSAPRRCTAGPAPPPHLSSEVVLLI